MAFQPYDPDIAKFLRLVRRRLDLTNNNEKNLPNDNARHVNAFVDPY